MTPTDKNRNLVIRVVTALVLLPGILWLIWLGGLPFAILIGAAAAMCALELNLLPTRLPPPDPKKSLIAEELEELEMERAVLTGAAIISVGGAFLLPLLQEVHLGFVSAKLVLVVVLIIAF